VSESLEVARRYSDAVRARDYEAAAALLAPDVEIVPPSGRTYGLEELQGAWAGPGFDHLEVSVQDREWGLDGDDVVERSSQVFQWRDGGGVAYTRPLETRYSFRDGRIVKMEMTSA
jgi:ketosteroid isomerase-like protein